MKTKSAKAKGRNLQNSVAEMLLESFNLVVGDVRGAIMGESGIDIKLSPEAKKRILFDIECKAQENLSIWQAIAQAEANSEAGRIPLLIFKRNRSKIYACLEFDKLLEVLK